MSTSARRMLAEVQARLVLPVVLSLAACGDDGGAGDPDAAIVDSPSADSLAVDESPGTFTLTSSAFVEGSVIPLIHVCMGQGGMNISPALMWTNPPAGTMSFAVVFTDIFRPQQPFLHSAIYDIPATAAGLPEDVEKAYAPADVPGAHQTLGYNNTTRGYLGPCPNVMHTYEFAVYALPTATLQNATQSTSLANATTMIMAASLGVAKLTGTHTPP